MFLPRLLLFTLIPTGAFLLYLAIRLLKKSLGGPVISEVPFAQKISFFRITEPGTYSVWQKGQFFRKLPVDQFRPVIYNNVTGEEVSLFPSIFRPNSNNGVTVKMELFRFEARQGMYRMELTEGSSISGVEKVVSRLFPVKKADPSKYFILIRQSQPLYFLILGIILASFSGMLMIGGLVAAIVFRDQ